MRKKIGFMQGRLSPLVNGKIQAFPAEHWRSEFASAQSIEISMMEWTIDQDGLYENPFLTSEGQKEILDLSKKHNVLIPSLTGDCFMQEPFYKAGYNKVERLKDFDNIIKACGFLSCRFIVFPLVDNGALKTEAEEELLISEMLKREQLLKDNNVKIVFESDYPPLRLKEFIAKLPKETFGINYDIGNSAALGFEPTSEFKAYGDRVLNVHIKDRVFGGTTVPLGTGDANFEAVFKGLSANHYSGNYILQTARSSEGRHAEFVSQFTLFALERLKKWN